MKLKAERTKIVDIPGDEDGGYVELRNLSLEEVDQIEGKYIVITEKGGHINNYTTRTSELAVASLKGWGNITDERGNPLKYNPKNIDKLSKYNLVIDDKLVRFLEWVNEEREKFAEEVKAEELEAAKN